MATSQESLFSLELVVDKLYIPYATCRFPAVAFRLLDFPTILISHVEKDLSDGIKQKINSDPYYRVPNQFADLQDKQGNFMMKKGKSCLFKISVDTLAMHLSNTPMYIMVIDEYPEVPKLLGNSSLALNEVMDAVKGDIKRNGHTVPSVHGDKGLFKIYSLMGKEIGYMIMGFRLLSLGPGLISHLPSNAFVKRASDKSKEKPGQEKSVIEEIIQVKEQVTQMQAIPSSVSQSNFNDKRRKDKLNSTREMGSMTDVEKCDALMQTVEMDDEKIHVAVSDKAEILLKTIETQTERRRKAPVKKPEDFQIMNDESDSDDGIIINPNIVCPPPLFYNSKAEPDVQIERDVNPYLGYSSTFDEATLEDLSGDEHVDIPESNKINKPSKADTPSSNIVKEQKKMTDARTIVISNIKGADKENKQQVQAPSFNLEALSAAEPVFPLLTALLTELSKIQNPQLVNQAMQQVNHLKTAKVQQKSTPAEHVMKSKYGEILHDITEVDEQTTNVSNRRKPRKANKSSAQQSDGVPKHKGWIRKAPEVAVKKTKLMFGLTNTQRLRLAKQNPTWLETAEKEQKASKVQKQRMKQKEMDLDLETGNLSDTFTEVRRLAAKELEKATLGKSQFMTEESRTKRLKKKATKSRDCSPAKKDSRTRSKSPKSKKTAALKGTVRVREDSDRDSLEDTGADFAVDLDPDAREIESPFMIREEKLDSAADSAPSSRIEVHIPSARAYESDENENTFSNSYEEDTGTDRKDSKSKFPGFSRGDDTLPESIAQDGNQSFNTTLDEDSPLESTRVSKQFRPGPHTGESLFKSTDYDTKQFHSTDEPELQKLMSEDEKSETQPTPITDRSVRSQSPGPTAGANSMRLSMKFEVVNPKASNQSPHQAIRRSQQLKVDSMNARPTPTDTPRSRSSLGSPKQPSPRPRKQLRERRMDFKKESIHTESVSSYMPSESENILSLISDGSYSDDFHMSSEKEDSSRISVPDFPRLIPSTKLGFTIG